MGNCHPVLPTYVRFQEHSVQFQWLSITLYRVIFEFSHLEHTRVLYWDIFPGLPGKGLGLSPLLPEPLQSLCLARSGCSCVSRSSGRVPDPECPSGSPQSRNRWLYSGCDPSCRSWLTWSVRLFLGDSVAWTSPTYRCQRFLEIETTCHYRRYNPTSTTEAPMQSQ